MRSLTTANLRAANLNGASLENANVTGAIYDGDTTWPDGFDYVGRGSGAHYLTCLTVQNR